LNEAVNEESLPTSDARNFEQYVQNNERIREIVDEYRTRFRYLSSSNTIMCLYICVSRK